MDFKITSTKAVANQRCAGFTLIETLFTVGITTLCLAALGGFFVFSSHGFTTLFNYVDLDDANRLAMDQLTRDVRQANSVSSYTTNSLTLQDSDGAPLIYTFSPVTRTLTRTKSGTTT